MLLTLAAMPLSAQTVGFEFFEAKIRPVLANNCYGCPKPLRAARVIVEFRRIRIACRLPSS
jgi:hypothetical protein